MSSYYWGGGLFGTDATALTAMPQEDMRPLQWRPINQERANTLYEIHINNPMAARCRNLVLSHLFSAELEILNGEGERIVFDDAPFSSFLQKRFTRFLKDAYDMIMVYGVVPVVLVQDPSGYWYPMVPKFGTFRLMCAYSIDRERMYFLAFRPLALKVVRDAPDDPNSNPRYTAMRMRDNVHVCNVDTKAWKEGRPGAVWGEGVAGTGGSLGAEGTGLFQGESTWVPDYTVQVIGGLGSDPGVNGELRSRLTSILSNIQLTGTMAKFMEQAEFRMVNPPVTMQFHKTENPEDLKQYQKIADGTYYDHDSLFMSSSTTQKAAVQATEAQLRAIQQHLHLRAMETMHHNGTVGSTPQSFHVHAGESAVCIPKGLELGKNDTSVTAAGAKYMSLAQLTDDHIAGCYDTPLALVRTAVAVRGNITGQTEFYRQGLLSWARILGSVGTQVFMAIFAIDQGKFCDVIFGRKAVVDDSQFVRHGMKEALRNGVEVVRDEAGEVALPPPVEAKVMGETDEHITIEPNDAGPTPGRLKAEVKRLLAKNAEENARKVIKRGDEDRAEAEEAAKNGGKLSGPPRPKELVGDNFNVRINVSHMMNDKSIEHLFNISGIDLDEYQNIMRARSGFPTAQRHKQASAAAKMLGDMLRDPNNEGPREDSFVPEGVGLQKLGQAPKIVPAGLLLQLAEEGGDVNKWRLKRKELQREKEAKAKEAVRKKQKTEKKKKAAGKGK